MQWLARPVHVILETTDLSSPFAHSQDRQAAEEARKEAAIQAEKQQQLAAARQREEAVRSLQGRDRFVGRVASGSGRDGFNDRQQHQRDAPGRRSPSNGGNHVYSKYEQPPDR